MHRDRDLEQKIAARLGGFEVIRRVDSENKAAAVALTLVDAGFGAELGGLQAHAQWSSDAALILTRRAMTLRKHAGQWALPGGRIDPGETAEQAALRELSEEVGLHRTSDDILGRLDDVTTRSGFIMTPIVVIGGSAREMTANPAEVQSIHRIPLIELLRDDAPWLDNTPDNEQPELRMPVGDSWIAAPTAAILYQFRELCLLGRATRVAHFAQPRFTWR